MTVALAGPLRVTVAPFPPAPLMVPERVYVTVLKLTPVTLPLTVTFWLAGVKVYPLLLGVTV